MLNVGTWSQVWCTRPELAISAHLQEALQWATWNTKPGGRVVLRSTTSWGGWGLMTCSATNSFLRLANVLGKTFAPRFGAHFYDSWSVEAPRYADTCFRDHHYSCIDVNDTSVIHGVVGEAVVLSFLEFLLHKLP